MNSTATNRSNTDNQQPKRAKEVIAANVKSFIEQLEAGHSDALTAYLNAMSRFHNYSFGNILEIARQRPDATKVAGFWKWKELGRSVRKGEKGIRILAPIVGIRRKTDEEAAKSDPAYQNKPVLVGFRSAYVFDVSQTEGAELPELREISGDVGENRDRLIALIEQQGSCVDCPMRTGHNKLLFSDLGKLDACTSPSCYQGKVDAYVAKQIATKPQLVQISTAYGVQKEGSPVLPRNQYTEIRADKPSNKEEAKRPEYKVCKFTTEAIIIEGSGVGTVQKVCANPSCPVHHLKPQTSRDDEKWKAEQEKQRKEQAIANATGLRVLAAVSKAVPVRLMKRDLLFILEKLVALMDERRIETLARQHGIRQKRDDGGVAKTFVAFLRRADEGTLSRLTVEAAILLAAARTNPASVLRDAASTYKVDTDAIALKVKQEFAAKEKAKKAAQPAAKGTKKAA